jgi:hypothetical protein
VWLAGPISGLIAQPVIGESNSLIYEVERFMPLSGALSDSSTSRYRRRYWIMLSTVALVLSTLTLAYCQELAAFFVDLLAVGAGDWDEKRNKQVSCSISLILNEVLTWSRLIRPQSVSPLFRSIFWTLPLMAYRPPFGTSSSTSHLLPNSMLATHGTVE